jgi:hypothetical protein
VIPLIEVTAEPNPLLSEPTTKPLGKSVTEQLKQKKTEEQLSNSDKIDAIYEMLPLIKEAYSICQFMLENR